MTYYRFSNNGAMSDWGHAMFTEDEESVRGYGDIAYIYDGREAVNIESLHDIIVEKWNQQKEMDRIPSEYEDFEAEDIFNCFNPEDIVMSADAWDDGFLTTWISEYILSEREIKAVTTNDGAIVFDSTLITEVGNWRE